MVENRYEWHEELEFCWLRKQFKDTVLELLNMTENSNLGRYSMIFQINTKSVYNLGICENTIVCCWRDG